jgi:hypothetical protein
MRVWGVSYVTWNDPANPNGWSARWTVLLPTPIPLGAVSTSWAGNSNGGSITMTVPGGAKCRDHQPEQRVGVRNAGVPD